MGKEDVYESDYFENAEIFADLVNGVLYHGEQVVKPEELKEQDGELRSILGQNVRKTIRDKVRLWNGTALAVFAVENQTKVDYHMVIRAMLTESMAYDKQWKALKMKYERETTPESVELRTVESTEAAKAVPLTPDEFLSGMRKEDLFTPVITIVIYYGKKKHWDGARTLHELLNVNGSAEKILPFISDYKLNLFDYHEHENFEQFHSELQSVFEFLRYSDDRKLLEEKINRQKEKYGQLSRPAKILLTKLTNIKKLSDITEENFEKGDFDMCKAFEDMKEEGRIEGRAQEIIELGNEFKLSEPEILRKLQDKLEISNEKAKEYFTRFATA